MSLLLASEFYEALRNELKGEGVGHQRYPPSLRIKVPVTTRDMMNPTLRDTPTWTAALVIEGLTAFYRSILGQTYDALHVFFFAFAASTPTTSSAPRSETWCGDLRRPARLHHMPKDAQL